MQRGCGGDRAGTGQGGSGCGGSRRQQVSSRDLEGKICCHGKAVFDEIRAGCCGNGNPLEFVEPAAFCANLTGRCGKTTLAFLACGIVSARRIG